jgi:hypothetical protein
VALKEDAWLWLEVRDQEKVFSFVAFAKNKKEESCFLAKLLKVENQKRATATQPARVSIDRVRM